MNLDVRTKVLLLLFTNYLLLNRLTGIWEWASVSGLALLFLFAGKKRKAMVYSVIFIVLFILDERVMIHTSGKALSFLSMLAIGGRLMLPCFMAGSYLLSTSSVSAMLHALRKWRVPEPVLLTFAVMMRFLPTIKEEYATIRQSLRLRGVFVSGWDIVKRPAAFFEYVTVPLLMSAGRTAQDLTIATLTKAIGSYAPRTAYREPRWRATDWCLCVMLMSVVVVWEWRKWQ